ncbi:hypothetical protein Tco_0692432 [Tanacetum coccineum]
MNLLRNTLDICQEHRSDLLLVVTMKMEILLESLKQRFGRLVTCEILYESNLWKLDIDLVKTVVTVSQSTKVDSFPHVHAHSTKTIYLEAPVFKDKDFANSDLEAFKIEHSMKMLAKDT